ncbi:MAG: glutathione ABC transporter permease GsiC [Sulfobacillus acidophilus]|uniref:Glutathione ABC transporter permease GsiC n=1 Tax=Sulfobacillus acidophilus TaxID=53633 RepID=A0A2T2WDL8_9FIRM|nr:MAG: glutathione ABC transporter permease GsiC [Sulfobacillus acidophilus]
MLRHLVKRFLWSLFDLLIIVTITFILTYLLPGDPARTIAGPHATLADVLRIRRQLGLDAPLYVQYGRYLWNLVHLNLGTSIEFGTPVLSDILAKFPATALLAATGVIWELILGLPLGVFSAIRRGGVLDQISSTLSMAAIAMPQFWVGIILLFVLAFKFHLFPLGGYGTPVLWYAFLPGLTLGIGGAAYYQQLIRSRVLEVLPQQYIATARAKGLSERQVLLRHVMPQVLTTLITQIGMDAGYFMAGVVVVETVFGWPGIGLQAWTAIQALDVPLVIGTVLFGAFWIVLANFVVDSIYGLLDPRIRLR